MSDALVLQDVVKRYGDFTAVDRLSLRVPQGEIVGFLGPNGAGKTTTIRMVMSINYPDSGEIRVLGCPRAAEMKDRVGYLPEERGLYRKMTVEQTLQYFGRLKGVHGERLTRATSEGLERVGLAEWRRKKVESLSKGMQQKVQFIATTLHEPDFVILDEPFSGLDPLNRELLENMMLDLKRSGRTVLFSTHQMEQAERLCDRIVLINRGRKLIEGTVNEVRGQFASRIVVMAGEGDFSALSNAPGVRFAHVRAGAAEFELAENADPAELLRTATQAVRLSRFEVRSPNLQEIFIKLVSGDGHAAVRHVA
jgi:ABC-2 type transport system ATP-binding protein